MGGEGGGWRVTWGRRGRVEGNVTWGVTWRGG